MASSSFQIQAPGGSGARGGTGGAACMPKLKSGTAVLFICATQIVVSLCLLGIYEGYKAYYYNTWLPSAFNDGIMAESEGGAGGVEEVQVKIVPEAMAIYEDPLDWRSPMGATYYLAMFNSIFAVFGLAAILNAQRLLILCYFAYNVAQMVVAFHFFVDMLTDSSIKFNGEPGRLNAFEKASTAFCLLSWLLSCAAAVHALRALEEIKAKSRDEYNRFTVLSDTLQYEPDM